MSVSCWQGDWDPELSPGDVLSVLVLQMTLVTTMKDFSSLGVRFIRFLVQPPTSVLLSQNSHLRATYLAMKSEAIYHLLRLTRPPNFQNGSLSLVIISIRRDCE